MGIQLLTFAGGGTSCPLFLGQIEIWNVGFCGGRKTLGVRMRTNNTLNQRACVARFWNQTRATEVGGKLVRVNFCSFQKLTAFSQKGGTSHFIVKLRN